ncbi:MAG TPA: ADP-polyphosphate phosphotransferase [Eoetvoesiella sp.]|uniref:ADP-polyphosphate phosphotransferase n=1 Tax=Eoetvoesiella sp. TaxID=1966355 RepID=UPI002C1F7518|nr:ADP-polyphosphate phosphotransferase [Eoetvoesiella sp.]HWK62945.1 ADP-polyphosphate phosphotransferase [Eoetvoesiella sp.]
MKIDPDDYRVHERKAIRLDDAPTETKPLYKSKDDYSQSLREQVETLAELQEKLYASSQYAILVIFQAMDAAGKDSTIKAVMSGINPQGCQVTSFKQPTALELRHDFLWRAVQRLPERGMIGIFNRSYYEEVLISRVHPSLLVAQNIPDALAREESIWEQRYRSINELESHLARNGTRIVKFFLHVSEEEQRKRLLERVEVPEKNWKFNLGDLDERRLWPDYMAAYEKCLNATSTAEAPWYVIPADDKNTMRLIVSEIIINTLKDLRLAYPAMDETRLRQLEEGRARLKEDKRRPDLKP